MALEKTEAIVLKSFRYGDSSKIVSLYTRRFGKIRVIAKGARSKKPRFGASLEPFAESLVIFYRKQERELQLLSSSDTIHGFMRLRERQHHLGFACAMVESIERLTPAEEEDAALYDLLRSSLVALEATDSAAAAETAFWRAQKGLVDHIGYRWELESCVGCGGAVYGTRVVIDPLEGTLCAECAHGRRGCPTIGAASRAALAEGIPAALTGSALAEVRHVFALFYERCGFGKGPLRSLAYLATMGDEPPALPTNDHETLRAES